MEMRTIDKHLQKLLGDDWWYNHRSEFFTWRMYCIQATDDRLVLKFNGDVMEAVDLFRFADIDRVHEALKKLFAEAFPRYTGDPNPDILSDRS